jgi:hypothetical protein
MTVDAAVLTLAAARGAARERGKELQVWWIAPEDSDRTIADRELLDVGNCHGTLP